MNRISTLRLDLTPVEWPADCTPPEATAWWAWECFTREPGERLGTLVVVQTEEGLRGPTVWESAWGEGGRMQDSQRGSLLKEAAVAALEACLDATSWQVAARLVRHSGECCQVDPSRIGFRREGVEASGEGWIFEPARDGFDAEGIVAAISGGGLRATGFALGAFSVLHELGALPKLRCVSSVSGGSIFSGAWAADRARRGEEASFEAFSQRLLRFIAGLDEVGPAVASVPPSLVRRFAELCAAQLLAGGDGQPLRLGEVPTNPELVFQATEMVRGGSFVFAATGNARVRQGAPNSLNLPKKLTDSVRLADAVAASAAFPIGFEPFVFPRDFSLEEGDRREAKEALAKAAARGSWPRESEGGVPLVDGGVFDNQGIRAALNAVQRKEAELLVVIDVDQSDPGVALLLPTPLAPGPGWTAWLLIGALLFLGGVLWIPQILLFVMLGVLLVLPPFVLWWAGRRLPEGLYARDFAWPHLFVYAAWRRAQVAQALLADVFMRRVRRLSYSDIYSQGPGPRVEAAVLRIQDLPGMIGAKGDTQHRALLDRYPVRPEVLDGVREAVEVGTTLRLPGDRVDRELAAKNLYRAGRATAILKLLLCLHRVGRPRTPEMRRWLERLGGMWERELR